jgi:hypothetical protein
MKGWQKAACVGVGAFVLGGALGASGSDKTKTVTVTKDHTVTVTSIVTREHTVSVNVPRTPQACKDALDSADKIIAVAGDFATTTADVMQASSDGLTAVSNFDATGINDATGRIQADAQTINGYTDQVNAEAPTYKAARDACQGS